jgi:hypothetical protein
MWRPLVLLSVLAALAVIAHAQDDDGPPISITSPDTGTTYALGEMKSHTLLWNPATRTLIARVVFTDVVTDSQTPEDDTHEFRLPGVTLDPAKGIFFARSAKGEVIPIAKYKKQLFLTSIETLPNAHVRVLHPHGNLTVILEAISPDDPAMHARPPSNPDGEQEVDIRKILP